jgi:Zn-dependent peptidase ImmA (M78 family)/transcriptional regulator with XRE-family HTH domain
MPRVNHQILSWARETAGFSPDDAAKKLSVSPRSLASIEAGEKEPSPKQLQNMAEKYRRPLLTFYMPTVPTIATRGQDFRTLPEAPEPASNALVDALVRDVLVRQELVRSALEEAEEAEPRTFVSSATLVDSPVEVVGAIRETLKFDRATFRRQPSVSEAFKVLRAAAERAGVFVILQGNLGTHHSDIDARVFRGFALADKVAPFIVINEKDSRAAWSFTLLHELAHIWLGQTGISGYNGDIAAERFCDAVASAFLLDAAELAEIDAGTASEDALVDRITDFAGARNLSRKMVAYNLLRSGQITGASYSALSDRFDAERKQKTPKGDGGPDEGGPDYYVVRKHRVGAGLVGFVERMVQTGVLSTTKAGRVLGVKATAVDRMVSGPARH